MPIKHTIKVDNDLEKGLGEFLKNPKASFDIQGVITLSRKISQKDEVTMVKLYPKDKYAEFQDEFTQTAKIDSDLKSVMNYIYKNNWTTNLK